MIDDFVKDKTQLFLNPWQSRFLQAGLKPKPLMIASISFGLVACFCVAFQTYIPAIIFIFLNRLFDSLSYTIENEGAQQTFYLKSVFDNIFFGGFIFFFSLGATNTSLAAACLILALFILHSCDRKNETQKVNIIENSEIIIFMVVCCLYPQGFAAITIMFAILCVVDAIKRFYDGARA